MDIKSVQARLEAAVLGNRSHHALIFSGPDSQSKEAVAKHLAHKLLLKNAPESLQSNASYVKNLSERVGKELHPDVLWVREADEDTLKIDRIREVCHQMEIAPLEGAAKICILQDCHRLNTAAANAFLKTLEEPLPGRFFWLMTSQMSALLPTLVSRCLVVVFPPVDQVWGPEFLEQWTGFEEAWRSGKWEAFAQKFEEKSQLVEFVRGFQALLRKKVLEGNGMQVDQNLPSISLTPIQALLSFEKVVHLENQLRSNANYSLLMESAFTELHRDVG